MVIQALKIEIEGKEYTVTGADFYSMLSQVKELEGRKWDGDRKLWKLPGALDEVRAILSDLQILGDEDEVLDAETAEIKNFQKWILEDIPAIEQEIADLEANKGGYTGKWRNKEAKRKGAWCLRCAIKAASQPIEKLTEPEINGMKRACEIMGWL
jgi:hypothetical protein